MASSGQSLPEEMAEHRGELDTLAARFVGREEDEMTVRRMRPFSFRRPSCLATRAVTPLL